MTIKYLSILIVSLSISLSQYVYAGGSEISNECRGTNNDPCIRAGYCAIQGSDWLQTVLINRMDIFDTQGWPGICDMVHVSLVQENCEINGDDPQMYITAYIGEDSSAYIESISGTLSCGGDGDTTTDKPVRGKRTR